jgi:hypothetical protein
VNEQAFTVTEQHAERFIHQVEALGGRGVGGTGTDATIGARIDGGKAVPPSSRATSPID